MRTAAGIAMLAALVVTGASAALRDAVGARSGGSGVLATIVYVVVVSLMSAIVSLPFAFYQGVTLERRYGLSKQATARWWVDQVKAGCVGLVFVVSGALLVSGLMRADPDRWWMLAAVGFAGLLVLLVQLAPLVLLPIFYDFKPLDRGDLVARLVRLADRAGARVMGVFEWRLGDKTRKGNAALTGIGQTRRIIISDTILAEHSDEEIEVILAHELAHHVHRDIWKGIALETALIALGFYLADRLLTAFAGSFGLTGKGDVAALPLLLLAAGAVSLALLPVANALSRAHERSADRYALEMTRNAPAFVSAMKRLAAQNLAEEHPSRLVQVLFYTHPPVSARIDAAHIWADSHLRQSTERT
jgi:STE24 endopeptidase